jgi:fatty acid desaturase
MDFLFRCFYNLASKQQPLYPRLATAHCALCLWLLIFIIVLYSFLLKQAGPAYLPRITDLVYVGLCGIAAGVSMLYFTRHPRSYWASYQGNTGKVRVSYALLGVLSFCLLAFISSFL